MVRYFTHLMFGTTGMETFQFHQTVLDRIIVRLVGAPGGTEKEEGRRIREQVEVEVPSFELSAAGKHRFTRLDVAAP